MTRPPLIGLTSYVEEAAWGVWEAPAALVPLSYVRAVESAGGRPVVLPPHDGPVETTLDTLDGIVLVGGADIDPAAYGARRHPETAGTRPDRDRSEQALLEGAVERDMPVLGVCRGMQLLNVWRGGDLVQHLEDPSAAATHKQAPGVFSRHDVKIAADSRLGRILGERAMVLSHHHQAPRCLGRDLEAVAWADDGTVEAIEDRSRRFLLGILWHPEEGEDRALFKALVDSAAGVSEEASSAAR